MTTRDKNLDTIANFLSDRRRNVDKIKQEVTRLHEVNYDQFEAIVQRPEYPDSILSALTVRQIAEFMRDDPYFRLKESAIRYALIDSNLGMMKSRTQPRDLTKRGIYTHFGTGHQFPKFEFTPSLLIPPGKNAPVVVEVVRPEQINQTVPEPIVQETVIEVEKECTRAHMPVPSLDGLMGMRTNNPTFWEDGTLTSLVNNQPVVAMAFLSADEIKVLTEKFGDQYRSHEPIVMPKEHLPS